MARTKTNSKQNTKYAKQEDITKALVFVNDLYWLFIYLKYWRMQYKRYVCVRFNIKIAFEEWELFKKVNSFVNCHDYKGNTNLCKI